MSQGPSREALVGGRAGTSRLCCTYPYTVCHICISDRVMLRGRVSGGKSEGEAKIRECEMCGGAERGTMGTWTESDGAERCGRCVVS